MAHVKVLLIPTMHNPDVQSKKEASKLPQYIAAFTVCLGAFANGGVIGWTANISEDMKRLGYNDMDIDNDSLGWIGSMVTLGSGVGSVLLAFTCNMMGRKRSMMFITIPLCAGWLLIIFAKWLWMIYLGRFLNGVAVGGFCVVLPVYISESTEKTIRGKLGGGFDLFATTGALVTNILAMITNMNLYTIIVGMFPLLFAFTFAFQPESPIYLVSKNQDEKAKKSLVRLRGKLYDVDTELQNIKRDLIGNTQDKTSFLESIKTVQSKKSLMICSTIMVLQQLGGIYAIIFYTSSIFESTGVKIDAKLSTVIFAVVKTIASLLSASTVDKLGRRILLISSGLGMGTSIACLAIFFTLRDRFLLDTDVMSKIGLLPLVSLSIYVVSYSIGMGPITYILSSEILPSGIKSFGMALVNIIGCISAFFIISYYFNIESTIGSDMTFYLSSIMAFISVAFVYFVVPETKGKSLEQIQKELGGPSNTTIYI